jgi:hypothetical protein
VQPSVGLSGGRSLCTIVSRRVARTLPIAAAGADCEEVYPDGHEEMEAAERV